MPPPPTSLGGGEAQAARTNYDDSRRKSLQWEYFGCITIDERDFATDNV
jgi:hypothetical protein